MRIEAAGKTWIVEEQELSPGVPVGESPIYGITFRTPERDSDVVQVRWVVKPPRMTRQVALELFDLAGVRLWRDLRDGEQYRVHLECHGFGTGLGGPTSLRQSVHFQSTQGSVRTDWPPDLRLGFASDADLAALLDDARA